ncbi:MAG: hypothetical protein M5F18_02135 [Asgard group archaeon]|nr:hypothetical protein [Asgard group archaeon]
MRLSLNARPETRTNETQNNKKKEKKISGSFFVFLLLLSLFSQAERD